MQSQDKAKNTIPLTPTEELIRKVDRRDRLMRVFQILALAALGIFNVYAAISLEYQTVQNQKATVAARQANVDRQTALQGYIKCVLLIRYDNPASMLTTKEQVSKALDTCAASSQ